MADPTATAQELNTIESGVNLALSTIQHALSAVAAAENWPLVGASLQSAFNAGSALDRIQALQAAIDNGIGFAVGLLGETDGATAQAVATHINEKLTEAGFGNTAQAIVNDSKVELHFFSSPATTPTSIPLTGNLTLAGVDLHSSGTLDASAGYNFNFTVGVDAAAPFNYYVDASGGNSLLSVNLNANTANFSADATVGFLKFAATDNGTGINANFSVTAVDPNSDGKIDGGELLAANVFNAQVTGGATANVHLHSDLGSADFPSINADLVASWNLGSDPTISFNNVQYDFGSFVDTFIEPILDKVNSVLKPFHQILAAFETDISPLDAFKGFLDRAGGDDGHGHDIPDGKITLFDFIKMVSPDTNLLPVINLTNTIEKIIDWAAYLQGKNFGPDAYDLGSFTLPYIGGVLQLTPQVTSGPVDLLNFLTHLTGGEATQTDSHGNTGSDILHDIFTDTSFQFPLITDPIQAFSMLLGQNADLFKLSLPEVSFGFGPGFTPDGNPAGPLLNLPFSFSPFPGVDVKLQGDLALEMDMAFGWDTRGLNLFKQSGFTDPTKLLDGFFIDDHIDPTTHADLPEAQIEALLQLTIEANVFAASIGGGGNLAADVNFDLNDTVNGSPADGRLYVDEFANALVHNPFDLFDVSGDVTAGFNAYVDAFGYNLWRYNSPRVVLADFGNNPNVDPNAPPPEPHLGTVTVSGGPAPLQLSVGTHAGDRQISDHTDDAETFGIKVDANDPSMVDVNFGGTDAADTGDGTTPFTVHTSKYSLASIGSIVGSAGTGDDQITVDPGIHAGVVLDGGTGIDTLDGGSGDDILHGGDDPDPVHFGRDYLSGHDGNDQLFGDNGDDVLEGGAGADRLDGGDGNDIATYQHAAHSLTVDLSDSSNNTGDALGDTLVSIEIVEGSDSTVAEAGHSYNGDTLIGSDNADSLFGLAGDDFIAGAGGDDVLVGGAGADVMLGGTGTDTASYISAPSGVSVTLTLDTQSGEVNGSGSLGDANGDQLFSIEKLEGSGYNDTFVGGDEADVFMGLDGDDHLSGNGGNDILEGGAGADGLDGGAGVDLVTYVHAPGAVTLNLATGGTAGDAQGDTFTLIENVEGSNSGDNITGDGNANVIHGIGGSDQLHGGGGGDMLFGDDGDDQLFGDDGDDIMVGGAGADAYDGGAGTDTVTYMSLAVAVAINLGLNTAHGGDAQGNSFASDADGDTFTSVEVIYGTDLAASGDSLVGDDSNNTFYGMNGDDFIAGAGGHDTLFGGLGDDTLHGDAGNDTLQGDEGNDTLDGGADNDTLVSSSGNDTLIGGGGIDTADYQADPVGVIVNLSGAAVMHQSVQVAAHSAADGFGGTDSLSDITIVQGTAFDDALYAAESGSQLNGNGGNDDLFGNAGVDTIHGNTGNDTIDGGASADTLFGDDGIDNIKGGDGDDTLLGGAGADTLDGQAGNNTVSYVEDSTGVIVNLDTVNHTFGGHTIAAGAALDGSGSTDTLLNLQNVTGTSFDDAIFGDGNVNILNGGAGNDSLDGRGGADTLIGSSGDDTYYVDSAADNVWDAGDSIGGGNDKVIASVDYSLSDSTNDPSNHRADIEQLQLVGSARVGTGNGLDNIIVGNDLGDTISGGGGTDTITTGSGNDTIDGGAGADIMTGGLGDDTYVIDTPDGSFGEIGDRVVELPNGGIDTLQVRTANYFVLSTIDLTADWAVNIENVTLLDHVEDGLDDFEGYGLSVKGNDLDNYVLDNAGKNSIDTGFGNDTVELTGGNPDVVHLGDGVDTLFINYAQSTANFGNTLIGSMDGYSGVFTDNTDGGDYDGAEIFHIVTGSGNDQITTGAFSDVISAGAGNDVIISGTGDDTTGLDVVDGGDGIDGWGADKSNATQAIHLDLVHNTYSGPGSVTNVEYIANQLRTGSGDDVIVTGAIAKNESITTNAGNDTVTVAGGNDDVSLGAGVDTLIVDYSAATHAIATPNFAINDVDYDFNPITWLGTFGDGRPGGYQVNFDGVEKFNITTGSGNDVIQTGDNNDIIATGAGDDTINPGEGANVIDGGDGNDTVDLSSMSNQFDRLSFFWTSSQNLDGSWSFTNSDGATSTFRHVEHVKFSDQTIDLTASTVPTLTITATHNYRGESFAPVSQIEFATTTDATATFDPSQFSAQSVNPTSTIVGDVHVDTIAVQIAASGTYSAAGFAFSSWDTSDSIAIMGSAGNDVIIGSAQHDVINGCAGFDTLSGGTGADTFVLDSTTLAEAHAGSPIVDEIRDYDLGTGTFIAGEGDVIDVSAITGAAVAGGQSANNLVRIVDDPSNAHRLLQVDADGTANGIAWTTIAKLDGVHGGDAVTVALDTSHPAGTTFNTLTNAGHFGDFDGDHMADLVWRNDDGTVATWQMNGSAAPVGHFLPGVPSDWHIMGTGDFDADGHSDLLWQNDNGSDLIWQMTDSATLGASFNFGTTPGNSYLAGIGDVDADGKSDLIWRDQASGAVTVNTTAGASATIDGVGNEWSVVGVGDYNGDGNADIMFRNASLGTNAAWLMNGPTIGSVVFYDGVPNDWHVEATGDFNGDGTSDLFWHNDNGANAVWLMNTQGNVATAGFFDGVDPSWHVVGSGDFNADQKDDLIWRNNAGATAVWQMDGTNAPVTSFPGGVPTTWETQAHHYDYV